MDRIGSFVYRTYKARLPQIGPDGRETRRHKVVIAGGGPVGMAVALGLATHGVASVVIEADDSVCVGSRAICISRRSLEILTRLGVADGFLKRGLPWVGGRSYYRDAQVLHFEMPHDENQKLPPMINIGQFEIEQLILDGLESRYAGLVDMRWASTITGLERSKDGVSLTVECAEGRYGLDADWLVACDGGQSFVRRSLGLELQGTAYAGRYVIADIALESRHPTERRAWFDSPANPGSTILMHKQPDDIWRIDYQVDAEAEAEDALDDDRIKAFVQRHLDSIGETKPWQLVWKSMYRAGAMTLERYRHGPILFAGNAAHAMPIFGVRGLNSGLDDADNLAWKLAFVAKGLSPPDLLDSYDAERLQAYRDNARQAMKSTEFMAPPSRGFDLMRTAALSLAERHPGLSSLINPRQSDPKAYAGSPLSSPQTDELAAGPAPGATLPECPVAIGSEGVPGYLTDTLWQGFTAVAFTADGEIAAPLAAMLAELSRARIPVRTVIVVRAARPVTDTALADATRIADPTGRLYPMYGARPGTLYLVRPDGHVAARWHDPRPEAVADAVARAAVVVPSAGSAGR